MVTQQQVAVTDGGGFGGVLVPVAGGTSEWLPQGLPPEIASELLALQEAAGFIMGEIAAPGDVDITTNQALAIDDFLDEAMAMLPKLGQLLQSPDPEVQAKAYEVLDALCAGMEKAQDFAADGEFGWVTSNLLTGLCEPMEWLRSQPDLGAVTIDMSTITTSMSTTTTTTQLIYNGPAVPPGAPPSFEQGLVNGVNGSGFTMEIDVTALVLWLLRQSYLETTLELRDHAEKVKFYNEIKKQIREELKLRREQASGMAGEEDEAMLPEPFMPESINDQYYGRASMPGASTEDMTPEQRAAYEANLQARTDKTNATAAYAAYEEALNAAEPNVKFSPSMVTDSAPDFSKDGHNYGRKLGTPGINYGNNLVAWYHNLPPDQKEWVREQLEAGNLSIRAYSRENDSTNADEIHIDHIFPDSPLSSNATDAQIEEYLKEWGIAGGEALDAKIGSSWSDVFHLSIEFPAPDASGQYGVTTSSVVDWSAIAAQYGVDTSVYPTPESVAAATGAAGGDGGAWTPGQMVETKLDLDTYIENLEEQLSSVGDDAQIANVDMQNCLQRQQQTLQLMSNMSKSSHEMKTGVIRNIGG